MALHRFAVGLDGHLPDSARDSPGRNAFPATASARSATGFLTRDSPAPLDHLRAALDAAGHTQAVLSHPETLASLGCFETPDEDWPGRNAVRRVPALLCLGPAGAILVVADFHAPDVRRSAARGHDLPLVRLRTRTRPGRRATGCTARRTRRRRFRRARRASRRVTCPTPSPTGSSRPVATPSPATTPSSCDARPRGDQRACCLADVVQQAVKDHAAPGISEAELAGLAAAAMFREAGKRVPGILTVSRPERRRRRPAAVSRPGASSRRATSSSPTRRRGSTAAGPTPRTPSSSARPTGRRATASTQSGARCTTGSHSAAPASSRRTSTAEVREMLAEHGPTYATTRATASALRGRRSRESRRTATERIDEGMVLALEPAIYLPGWGGIRLEHVVRRRRERQRDPDAVRAHAVSRS